MGSIFRLADAFKVKEIIFCGTLPDLKSSRLRRTARNTERTVSFRESDNINNSLDELKSLDFICIALEIASDSVPISSIEISSTRKIALIVGSEREGINHKTLKKCRKTVHIPMFGVNSSMNVAQAMGIALYELTRS